MKRFPEGMIDVISKAKYLFGATILISLLMTSGLVNYASANPGCNISTTPNFITPGSGFTVIVDCAPTGSGHPWHTHELAYNNGPYPFFPGDNTACVADATTPGSVEIVTAAGNPGILAGLRVHFSAIGGATSHLTYQIVPGPAGTPATLIAQSGIAIYVGNNPPGPAPTFVPPNMPGGVTQLFVTGNNPISTAGTTPKTNLLCTFIDGDNTFALTNYPGDLATDPDTDDSFDASISTVNTVAPPPVGGEIIAPDMTALFLAGIFTSASWMAPTAGGIAGAILAIFKIKRER
jgi:hypothetical protein